MFLLKHDRFEFEGTLKEKGNLYYGACGRVERCNDGPRGVGSVRWYSSAVAGKVTGGQLPVDPTEVETSGVQDFLTTVGLT